MRSHYGEPSGDFTLILTKDELHRLESTGRLSIHTPEIPCEGSRIVYNPERQDMDVVDERRIESAGLTLLEYTGDLKSEHRYIQFLNIRIEDKERDCDICQLNSYKLPTYRLTHTDGTSYEGMAHFCPNCGRYMGMLPRYEGNC